MLHDVLLCSGNLGRRRNIRRLIHRLDALWLQPLDINMYSYIIHIPLIIFTPCKGARETCKIPLWLFQA